MNTTAFNDMPDHSRVWIYQSGRVITDLEAWEIRKRAAMFLLDWSSHGSAMRAVIEVVYNRFIVVMVDEGVAAASGCGIDKSVRFMQQLEQDYGMNLFDRLLVLYRDEEGKLQDTKLQYFERFLETGEVKPSQIVFNNLIATKTDLFTKWEVPVTLSWHARLLPVNAR
jgi:hypothetical protein